jgi:hypothetical protein
MQAAGGQPSLAEHDIAPWDGAAFGIWIPAEQYGGKPDSWIYLRIWSAPEDSQRKFVFPDNSMKVGHVVYFLDLESPRTLDWTNQPRQELEGWVEFIRASVGQPIVGEFDFVSKFDFASQGSISLKGRFEAAWIDERRVEGAQHGDTAIPRSRDDVDPVEGPAVASRRSRTLGVSRRVDSSGHTRWRAPEAAGLGFAHDTRSRSPAHGPASRVFDLETETHVSGRCTDS